MAAPATARTAGPRLLSSAREMGASTSITPCIPAQPPAFPSLWRAAEKPCEKSSSVLPAPTALAHWAGVFPRPGEVTACGRQSEPLLRWLARNPPVTTGQAGVKQELSQRGSARPRLSWRNTGLPSGSSRAITSPAEDEDPGTGETCLCPQPPPSAPRAEQCLGTQEQLPSTPSAPSGRSPSLVQAPLSSSAIPPALTCFQLEVERSFQPPAHTLSTHRGRSHQLQRVQEKPRTDNALPRASWCTRLQPVLALLDSSLFWGELKTTTRTDPPHGQPGSAPCSCCLGSLPSSLKQWSPLPRVLGGTAGSC